MLRLVALVGAVVFLDTMFFSALTPLLPEYADDLGLTKAKAGILVGAYPAGVLIAGIPSGILASRIGVKPTILGGLFLLAGTTAIFGLADAFWVLVLARLIQGLASACAWTAGFTWLVGAAPPERRGELIGTTLGVAIAGALFGPVLGAVASLVGTAPVFIATGSLAFVLAAWAASTPAPPRGEPQPLSVLGHALRDRTVTLGLWLILLPALMFGTLTVLGPLDLSQLGFGAVAIGAVFLIMGIGEATVSPLIGRISDRRGRVVPLRLGLAASAVVVALLPWPDRRFVLAPLIVVAGMSFGSFWAPAMAWVSDAAEHRGVETAYGFALINLAWAPGQAIGAAAGGGIADATSDAVPYLALSVLCLCTLPALRRATRAAPAPAGTS